MPSADGALFSAEEPPGADGAGDPVQTDGVVPGFVAGGWFGVHALSSATQLAADSAEMAATAALR
jgi:hypothetical protein